MTTEREIKYLQRITGESCTGFSVDRKDCVVLVAQSYLTLCVSYGLFHMFLCPWDSPGKNTGVGCHFLLQEIFPTQGLNLGLLESALQADSLLSEPQGKPRKDWVMINSQHLSCCMQDNVLYIYLLIKFFLLASADDVFIIFILQK